MPTYLLRIEGVNLRSVIWDTDDLSTRRGGGLLLLDAVKQFAETVPEPARSRLLPMATGASIGLFTFDATEDEATAIGNVARQHFQQHGTLEYSDQSKGGTGHVPLKHATFVVDVVPAGSTPKDQDHAVQLATAQNRWRQMREPSLSLDGLWDTNAQTACHVNCVRPATPNLKIPKDPDHDVSLSVYDRHTYGRNARQRFYERETGLTGRKFTTDFTDLGTADGLSRDIAPETANRKLAVFYVDGNKFGEYGLTALREGGFAAFAKWSEALRGHHRQLLHQLLQHADRSEGWTNGGAIRLETLLWGGDEILWVVPAWKGWELAKLFFAQPHTVEGKPLSYGCGLVFCNLKAPIQTIITLAQTIADLAKAAGRATNTSRLAYEVMESFDDVAGPLDQHRRKWLPKDTAASALLFDPSQLSKLWEALRAIAKCKDFPRRQLHMLIHAWRTGKPFADHTKRLLACEVKTELETVRAGLGHSDVAWLHLLQMLPYLPTGGAR